MPLGSAAEVLAREQRPTVNGSLLLALAVARFNAQEIKCRRDDPRQRLRLLFQGAR